MSLLCFSHMFQCFTFTVLQYIADETLFIREHHHAERRRISQMLKVLQVEHWLGLVLGVVAFLLITLNDPCFGMPDKAWKCLGLVLLMVIWWATEAVPLPVTALLPMIFIPLLGLGTTKTATAPYANPTIYLFFGGFLLGLAMEKCNLHKRIALNILAKVGSDPKRQIAGFMIATGFISMWVSNTATAIMMLPIGISVVSVVTHGQEKGEARRFGSALMLAIAYASSIGGMGTLIGTPPNALLRAFLAERYGIVIGFGQWMILGVPLVIVLTIITWWWLTRRGFNFEQTNVHEHIEKELAELGPISHAEVLTSLLFSGAAACWILQPLISSVLPFVDDTFIAITFGILLFIVPVDFKHHCCVMEWKDARKLPWGILLLFGGGLSLAGTSIPPALPPGWQISSIPCSMCPSWSCSSSWSLSFSSSPNVPPIPRQLRPFCPLRASWRQPRA